MDRVWKVFCSSGTWYSGSQQAHIKEDEDAYLGGIKLKINKKMATILG